MPSTSQFGSFNSGHSNHEPFNCYNGMLDTQICNQSVAAPIFSSPEAVEDPSWYIDSGATSHITSDSGKLFNL